MDKAVIQNPANIWIIWQRGKKKTLIFFLTFYSIFLSFCLKEYLAPKADRFFLASSNIGAFVNYPNFYLHWAISLTFAVIFLFCPARIFSRFYPYFYGIAFSYFIIFFSFFIGSICGMTIFLLLSTLSIPLKK
ncbi:MULTISPECIES: hypothetical protein [Acinetobacter]|uniref:hypothetical protein n=1 Tax=Acinetobacter TaxID=469 RepID=UPI00097F71F4|nr:MULTISPECIES: hypothetical protein [Acinetobacter]MEB3795688.1 hypothetical protein [Acinetobacter sp. IK24]MEB3814837.1 hypothetical protein [Acinetobacter sp. IK22]MEB3834011.1 hypothetical protein [Acinetobacter sp. IK23]MEB3837277.1 hypothetical protein [Acinetobacter sp. IK25]ONN57441.1 hypothetical protein AC057_08670 [Acinetobacter genomosp. 33YU]